MSDDKKGEGHKPAQAPRQPERKSDDGGRSGRFNDGANRTTDYVKPERPDKKK
jgi:hypothetical protein